MKIVHGNVITSNLTFARAALDTCANDKAFTSNMHSAVFIKTNSAEEKVIVVKNIKDQQILHEVNLDAQSISRDTIEQRLKTFLARADVLYGAASQESIAVKERGAYQLAFALQVKLQQYASLDWLNKIKNTYSADARQQKIANRWQALLQACFHADIITAQDCRRLAHEAEIVVPIGDRDTLTITHLPAYQQTDFVFSTTFLKHNIGQFAEVEPVAIHRSCDQLQKTLESSIGIALHDPSFLIGSKITGKEFYYGVLETTTDNHKRGLNHASVKFQVDSAQNLQIKISAKADLFWDRDPKIASQVLAKLTAACYVRCMQTQLRSQLPTQLTLPAPSDSTKDSSPLFQQHLIAAFRQLGLEVTVAANKIPAAAMSAISATGSATAKSNNLLEPFTAQLPLNKNPL